MGYLRISRKVGPDPDWAALLAAQYRFAGKEKLLALGVYPEVSLQHWDRIWNRLETDIFRGWQSVQSTRSTHRKFSNACAVLRHEGQSKLRDGFDTPLPLGMAKNDPAEVLKGALTKCRTRPFPAITDLEQVGALLRAIDGLHVSLVVQCAARLAPILFVRSGELRHAEWPEIDLDGAEWRIPAEKMKSRVVHIVPPPSQALRILRELKPLTGRRKYVFPGERTSERSISENTINAALRRLGYSKQVFTRHSFRKVASTLLNESHLWHPDALERQLAHGERDDVRATYNYAEYLPERRRMMAWWARYLDQLKASAKGGSARPVS